ncbi:MAG: zinc ABC transporter substrate-binding protein [Verrucomicrobiae bacterium]|nr:zinc ABC transporter substrate-binding protein [Verrucomicrobiae bacterium]
MPILRSRFLVNLWLAFVLLLLSSCGQKETPQSVPLKPRIVTSFFPLFDFASNLGGEDFEVLCLTPPGGDPHAMKATPKAAQSVADSQLAVFLGFGLDGWMEKLTKSEPQVKVLAVGQGLNSQITTHSLLPESLEKDNQLDGNKIDPHVWLDPLLAKEIVNRLADEMAAIAPLHRKSVLARRDTFLGELQKLHEAFSANLADLDRREVVTFHGAFAYLFKRYQLETVGVVEQFPGDEPSAAYLRQLVDLMQRLKMKVIFAEPQLPDRPAQILAQEIGGRVELLDPCETILPNAPHASYLDRQRANLETLVRVLKEY